MSDIWFTSDTHFFHDNIIAYCGRPFANSEIMNECLIENWNSVVKPHHKVYHLGDVGMGCKDDELHNVLSRLNGKKRLILGNHDNPKSPALINNFQKIMLWNSFYTHNIGFTTTHIPLPLEHLRNTNFCVHGHTHNMELSDPHYMNVCVEHIGYTPIHIDVIGERLNKIYENEADTKLGERYIRGRRE